MWEDPIVKETRAARQELSARFNNDLAALCRHLREKELTHPDRECGDPFPNSAKRAGSAGGPKPGRAGFYLELGGRR